MCFFLLQMTMVMMREESFIISLLSNMDVDPFLQLSHSRLSLFLAFIFNMRLVAKNAIESFFCLYSGWLCVLSSCFAMPFPSLPQSRITTDSRQ